MAVVSRVAPSLEKCYKDIIASSLIPSWERICGTMFQQINETFTKGTKECRRCTKKNKLEINFFSCSI